MDWKSDYQRQVMKAKYTRREGSPGNYKYFYDDKGGDGGGKLPPKMQEAADYMSRYLGYSKENAEAILDNNREVAQRAIDEGKSAASIGGYASSAQYKKDDALTRRLNENPSGKPKKEHPEGTAYNKPLKPGDAGYDKPNEANPEGRSQADLDMIWASKSIESDFGKPLPKKEKRKGESEFQHKIRQWTDEVKERPGRFPGGQKQAIAIAAQQSGQSKKAMPQDDTGMFDPSQDIGKAQTENKEIEKEGNADRVVFAPHVEVTIAPGEVESEGIDAKGNTVTEKSIFNSLGFSKSMEIEISEEEENGEEDETEKSLYARIFGKSMEIEISEEEENGEEAEKGAFGSGMSYGQSQGAGYASGPGGGGAAAVSGAPGATSTIAGGFSGGSSGSKQTSGGNSSQTSGSNTATPGQPSGSSSGQSSIGATAKAVGLEKEDYHHHSTDACQACKAGTCPHGPVSKALTSRSMAIPFYMRPGVQQYDPEGIRRSATSQTSRMYTSLAPQVQESLAMGEENAQRRIENNSQVNKCATHGTTYKSHSCPICTTAKSLNTARRDLRFGR